jgi:hypothetical protein
MKIAPSQRTSLRGTSMPCNISDDFDKLWAVSLTFATAFHLNILID